MAITKLEVKKISSLAHLNLNDEELERLAKELGSILDYIAQLEKIPVEGVPPTSHAHGATNFFREDTAQAPMPIQDGLHNAPDRSGNFIRVPIIIDQGGEH